MRKRKVGEGKAGVLGREFSRWRELKNLSRYQILMLLGPNHQNKVESSISAIESRPDEYIPGWLCSGLSDGKYRRTTVECRMDLYDWVHDEDSLKATLDKATIAE